MMFLITLAFLLFPFSIYLSERILLFQSDVVVHKNATVTITETITVESHGKQIRRGIIRELPTTWLERLSKSTYKIKSIKKDGRPVFYRIELNNNRGSLLEIHIGGDNLIPHGTHSYEIVYTTENFLDFYKNYDELYLNITGNGWQLPIDTVKASITLPEDVDFLSITAEGYTGNLGEQKKEYRYSIKKNTIFFETTQPFCAGEGFTTVVTWNKGVIEKPFWYLHWYENPYFYILVLALFLQCLFLLWFFINRYRHNEPGTIVPLFYPPEGMTPSCLGYVTNIGSFKDRFLVADVVQLAVQGYISINMIASESFFGSTVYELELLKEVGETSYQKNILQILFANGATCKIGKRNSFLLQKLREKIEKECNNESNKFLKSFSFFLLLIMPITSSMLFLFFFLMGYRFIELYFSLCFVLSAVFYFFIYHFNRWYSIEGRKLQDKIDGFLLFLNSVEIDRINTIGTSPEKTPELYEAYLPFAIAVGAEYRWSKQFEKIFADMENKKMSYKPRWYRSNSPFSFQSFSSHLSSHLASSFRSSGAGGRGSSGGARGGGGGGGR